jgi:hypothetical protein
MEKSKRGCWLIGLVVLSFGFVLTGCDGGGGKTGARALVGTWKLAGGSIGGFSTGDLSTGGIIGDITWSFTGNKFTSSGMGVKSTVPYKVKGNSIVTEYQGAEAEIEFKIDGDILTLNVMGIKMEFERVK